MLGVIEVEEHQQHQHANHDDVEQILLISDLRQPANLRALVDDADFARPLRRLPEDAEVRDQLRRDIVHHQREQRLVRIPLCLEERRNAAPNRTSEHTGQQHHEYQRPVRQHIAQENHATGGGKAAHQRLTFAADVPEAHLKRRGNGEGNAQQHRHVTESHPRLARRAERAFDDRAVNGERVVIRQQQADNSACAQCQRNGNHANQQRLLPRNVCSLGNVKERLPFGFTHAHYLPRGSSSCRFRACLRRGRVRCR